MPQESRFLPSHQSPVSFPQYATGHSSCAGYHLNRAKTGGGKIEKWGVADRRYQRCRCHARPGRLVKTSPTRWSPVSFRVPFAVALPAQVRAWSPTRPRPSACMTTYTGRKQPKPRASAHTNRALGSGRAGAGPSRRPETGRHRLPHAPPSSPSPAHRGRSPCQHMLTS